MGRSVSYVIGGPLQGDIESRKRSGDQPRSEFNVFVDRNQARLVSTDEVGIGAPTSAPRRVALAAALARRSSEYDLLVASGEDIGFPLALALMAGRVSKPIGIIIHGSYLGTRKFAAIAPLLRRAKNVKLLCLSRSLQEQLVERYGFSEANCFNAGYGVDTSYFAPADAPADSEDDTPLIVSAGSSNRDYETLVASVAGLDVAVRIAADSLWRPRQADLEHDRLPASVQVGSAGNYNGLRALYARASIVVVPLHPARYASGYAVIAEAMAMGKVVVTTRTDAPSDFVVEGETGLYTEPGDVDALRGALRLLLEDPVRAQAMGAAAALRMRDHSLEAYCSRIEGFVGVAPEHMHIC